ncbi:hypothetical protein HHI36_020125, partial [Cryptolaemus montrouzieri]
MFELGPDLKIGVTSTVFQRPGKVPAYKQKLKITKRGSTKLWAHGTIKDKIWL